MDRVHIYADWELLIDSAKGDKLLLLPIESA